MKKGHYARNSGRGFPHFHVQHNLFWIGYCSTNRTNRDFESTYKQYQYRSYPRKISKKVHVNIECKHVVLRKCKQVGILFTYTTILLLTSNKTYICKTQSMNRMLYLLECNGGHERIFTSDHRPDGTTDLVEIFDKKAWLKRGSNWGHLSGSLVP